MRTLFLLPLLLVFSRIGPASASCARSLSELTPLSLDLSYRSRTGEEFPIHFYGDFQDYKTLHLITYESEHHFTEIALPEMRMGVPMDLAATVDIPWDGNGNMHFAQYVKAHPEEDGRLKETGRELAERGRARYLQLIDEYMDFYLGNVASRRDWPPEFREKLSRISHEFAERSCWIALREKNPDGTKGRVVATLRLIQADYGMFVMKGRGRVYCRFGDCHRNNLLRRDVGRKGVYPEPYDLLPMETYLGEKVRLYRPTQITVRDWKGDDYLEFGEGTIYEPGSWAIDRPVSKLGLAEAMIHLLRVALSPTKSADYNHHAKLFYTYADVPSRHLYEPLGFKPTLGEDGNPLKVLKDGIEWEVLQISTRDMEQWLKSPRDFRRIMTDEDAAKILDLFEALAHHEGWSLESSH